MVGGGSPQHEEPELKLVTLGRLRAIALEETKGTDTTPTPLLPQTDTKPGKPVTCFVEQQKCQLHIHVHIPDSFRLGDQEITGDQLSPVYRILSCS